MTSPRMSRAERRQQTEGRILEVARQLFSEVGYERTTIRSVAAAAEVDPGLVMHYFGSKQALFRQAAGGSPEEEPATGASGDELAEMLLASLAGKLREEPASTLAMLRSMLTHPEASDQVRDSVSRQQEQLSRSLATSDATLRTGLFGAISIGVTVGRYLLQLDGLRDATPEEITDLLRPGIRALIDTGPEPAGDGDAAEP